MEELKKSNEELKKSNEELKKSNEELEKSLEELKKSKDEEKKSLGELKKSNKWLAAGLVLLLVGFFTTAPQVVELIKFALPLLPK